MTSKETSTNNSPATRPPVITILGHVDHGKTSLLDAIRETNVAAREAGGITQHTAAYQIVHKDRKLTFIDTPGHAAFSEMRARGGKIADIIILVVSVPDGVQPQTIEAISHAKAAGVPIVVALNKIDLPGAKENLDQVKKQLAEQNLLLESWGGDVVSVEVSAKTKQGLPELLDILLLLADMAELKIDPAAAFEGVVVESRLDNKKGLLAQVICRSGRLTAGQKIYLGSLESKVRALLNDRGEVVDEVLAGDPVTILGFTSLPAVGTVVTGLPKAEVDIKKPTISPVVAAEGVTTLSVVLKSDTQGTLEALSSALVKLAKPDRQVVIINKGLGDVSDSDLLLASGSNAMVLGFNVKMNDSVAIKAHDLKVTVKTYPIIYEMLEAVEKILAEQSLPAEDKVRGRAEVIALFPLPSGDIIAGCKVTKGRFKTGEKVRILRQDVTEPVYTGHLKNIKEGKKEVQLITAGKECGLLLKPLFPDLQKGDTVEVV